MADNENKPAPEDKVQPPERQYAENRAELRQKQEEPPKTGHVWDGIEEYDNPMPRWWLWTFYITIIWALLYTIAYPAWPLVRQATPGLLGYSSRAEVAEDIDSVRARNAPLDTRIASMELEEVVHDPELFRYAVAGGAAVYRTFCSQCHGSGAQGAVAFPSLLNDDWLWGGTLEDIYWTIAHGVRNENDPDARWSQMPAFGEILDRSEIDSVAQYVLALAGREHDATLARAGEEVYLDNCAACHGDDGLGDRFQGAPNLTNDIWQYGGSLATITETITYSRFGVMPSWADRLTEAQVRKVTLYVHQLGGGE